MFGFLLCAINVVFYLALTNESFIFKKLSLWGTAWWTSSINVKKYSLGCCQKLTVHGLKYIISRRKYIMAWSNYIIYVGR